MPTRQGLDVHKVIVAISLPPEKQKTAKAGRVAAKAAANDMIDYQVYRNLTNRGFIVLPGIIMLLEHKDETAISISRLGTTSNFG